ncbi:MAG: hypothetical protein ACLQPD_26005 [Desulfomonilaceae bacterium]
MQKKNKINDRTSTEVMATQAQESAGQDNSAQASEATEIDSDSAPTQDSTGAVSSSDENGTGDKPLTASDADEQNDSSDVAQEIVTDEGSPYSEAGVPQTSEWEGGSDSVNTHGPLMMIPFQRSGGTGSENLPMLAPDVDDQNSKPSENPTDEPTDASDADRPQTLDKDGKPKEDDENDKELSEKKIDDLVHRIMANRNTADNAALETGQMLLDEVFGGNLSEACSRNPKKNNSFKSIVEHEELDLDATTLSRWVKAANLVRTFERGGKSFKHLTCSHYITLLSLKPESSQRTFSCG